MTTTKRKTAKPPRPKPKRDAMSTESFWSQVYSLAGSPIRLRILFLLQYADRIPDASGQDGYDVGQLTDICGISGSAVSQHLGKLKAWGLIEPVRDKNRLLYRVKDRPAVAHVVRPLAEGQ